MEEILKSLEDIKYACPH